MLEDDIDRQESEEKQVLRPEYKRKWSRVDVVPIKVLILGDSQCLRHFAIKA